jgi:hypothetical protein
MTLESGTPCPVCHAPGGFLRSVDEVPYYRCTLCGSLYAHPDFLAEVDSGTTANYGSAYWSSELASARQRSFGGSLVRVAETLRMARIPVHRFLDIGSGPGLLLDALTVLLPNIAGMFHGIELMPPTLPDRSSHPNYRIGSVGDLDGSFDAGVCIEVIEHLTPKILGQLLRELAARSTGGALYYFNSAQPSFVEQTDPAYLDPKGRGHIMSWSIAGASQIFTQAGFNVIPIPGRDWAFLAEFGPQRELSVDDLMSWLWHPVAENLDLFHRDAFGPLFETMGLEAARCYLEGALADGRGHWALALERQIREAEVAAMPQSVGSIRTWLRRLRRRAAA